MTADKSTQDAEQAELRPFAAFLHELAKGRTHEELSRALRDITAAVNETGKPGTLVLRIDIKPQPNTDGAVTVTDKVTTKIPALDRPASIFFVDDSDNLVRNHPHQPSIFDEESHTR